MDKSILSRYLIFLNKLHVKYAYHSPLYFSSYSLKYQNITISDFFSLKLRGLANVPAFLQFSYFMTHIVYFEKVNFLFFSLLKCQVSCQFLMNIFHLIKMQSEPWLVILRNGLGSKFTFLQRKIGLEKELKTLNDLC